MSGSPRLRLWTVLALPFLLGALLRLAGLPSQIFLDDEVHGLRLALSRTLGEIFSQYPIVDVSIPLSAFDRLLLNLGFPLTETTLRLPAVLAGLLALALIPWFLREQLPAPALLLLGLLVALSPWLVFYSRFARPYMPVTLTVFLALVLFRRFSAGGSWLDGLGYALLGSLSIYLFFLTAPVVLAPAVLELVSRPAGVTQRSRRGVWIALAGMGLLTALLLLPLFDDIRLAASWHLSLHPSATASDASLGAFFGILIHGLAILSGSTDWLVSGIFWIAVLRGAWVQRSTDRASFRFGSFVILFHLAMMTLALGLRLSHLFPVAFARYLIVLLPLLYAWAALGLLTPLRKNGSKRDRWVHWAAATLFVATWIATGPYVVIAHSGFWTSFAGSKQAFTRRPDSHASVRGEQFYRTLAEAPSGTIVLESPGDEHDSILQLYAKNQRLHKRRVLITDLPALDSSRLDLRNMIQPGPTAILRCAADFIVIHVRLFEEVAERFEPTPRHLEVRARNHETLARQLGHGLRETWGPPDYSDEWIIVWDLERLRRRGSTTRLPE